MFKYRPGQYTSEKGSVLNDAAPTQLFAKLVVKVDHLSETVNREEGGGWGTYSS